MNHRTKKTRLSTLAAAAIATAAAAGAVASFSIPWSSISGGSGTATGGPWSVISTIGQPGAASLAGGAFSMSGGYVPGSTPPAPPACPGDTNGDRLVNTTDLVAFLGRFGQSVPPGTNVDFNSDGVVNTVDLVFLLARFGTVCP